MWRESLEAALIVGILLTYLARSGERAGMRYVWAGALGAVGAAVAMGGASDGAAARLGPHAQEGVQAGAPVGPLGGGHRAGVGVGRHPRPERARTPRPAA